MKQIFGLSLILVSSFASALEPVLSCDVGSKVKQRVEIVRDSEMASTYIYYVRRDGKLQPFFNNSDDSRGSDVHVACVGAQQRALVVSGEFTANFLQGFVLIRNPRDSKIERFEFAEKSPPGWLYLGTSKTLLVLPTHGIGEINKKYIVYRHVIGAKKDADAFGVNQLPDVAKFEVIKLNGVD